MEHQIGLRPNYLSLGETTKMISANTDLIKTVIPFIKSNTYVIPKIILECQILNGLLVRLCFDFESIANIKQFKLTVSPNA